MARNPYGSNIEIRYESGMVDMVKSYRFLLKEFDRSRFPKYLEDAVYKMADEKFDEYMLANKKEYKHVFEWGATTTLPGQKLWQTFKANGLYTYKFLESREIVPIELPNTKYTHVFREKAAVMEAAPTVLIEPVESKYLRWRGKSGGEVKSYEGVVMQVAGGTYQNKFQNAFIMFWATGAGGTMADVTQALRTDPDFAFQYNQSALQGMKRSITMSQNKMVRADASGDIKAAALAREKIKNMERKIQNGIGFI